MSHIAQPKPNSQVFPHVDNFQGNLYVVFPVPSLHDTTMGAVCDEALDFKAFQHRRRFFEIDLVGFRGGWDRARAGLSKIVGVELEEVEAWGVGALANANGGDLGFLNSFIVGLKIPLNEGRQRVQRWGECVMEDA